MGRVSATANAAQEPCPIEKTAVSGGPSRAAGGFRRQDRECLSNAPRDDPAAGLPLRIGNSRSANSKSETGYWFAESFVSSCRTRTF